MTVLCEQVSEMCVRHWSDKDVRLRQIETGELYDDAVDVIPCRFTYEETDEPIEDVPEEDNPEYLRQIINELTGGED